MFKSRGAWRLADLGWSLLERLGSVPRVSHLPSGRDSEPGLVLLVVAVGTHEIKPQSASSFQASASVIPSNIRLTHKTSSADEPAQSKVVEAGPAKLHGQEHDAGEKREGLGPVLLSTKDSVPKYRVVSGKMI